MYETIIFGRDSNVATIALNRPQRLNAFDGRMHEELHGSVYGAGVGLGEETTELANRLAALPTKAFAQTKSSLHASFENDLATILEIEAEGQTLCGYTSDHEEGVGAFFEKRAPNFTGR